MTTRQYSLLDHFIVAVDKGMHAVFSRPTASRKNPAESYPEPTLTLSEKKHSAALMRINHAGEVCAQALYFGQAMTARSSQTKKTLQQSGEEETDHLAWCQDRLLDLGDHTSYLNPLWYVGSFSIGLLVGAINDHISLGFVVETERQVEQHLKKHLQQLPVNDIKSRQIIEQMCEDESQHATVALGAGAIELPDTLKKLMKLMSKVMTKTAYYW